MEGWKLTVWSRYRTRLDEVWERKTEPLALAREFRPFLRVTVDDVDGLRRALRETGQGVFGGRVTGPLGLLGIRWPFEILETRPKSLYRDGSHNALYREFEHIHRFEETPAGLVRYVDEVRFVPGFGPSWLSAEITRLLFVHRHHRAARDLPVDGNALARTWLRRERERRPADVAPATA